MGKHKKGTPNKKSSQTADSGKLTQNGTETRDSHKVHEPAQKSNIHITTKNKEQQQKKVRSSAVSSKGSSIKYLLVLSLLSFSVAVCGVVYMNEIQEFAEITFRTYIQPQVSIFQQMIGSEFGDDLELHQQDFESEPQTDSLSDEGAHESPRPLTSFSTEDIEDSEEDINEEVKLPSQQTDNHQTKRDVGGSERSQDGTDNSRKKPEYDEKVSNSPAEDVRNSQDVKAEEQQIKTDIKSTPPSSGDIPDNTEPQGSRVETAAEQKSADVNVASMKHITEQPEENSNVNVVEVEGLKDSQNKDPISQPDVPDRATYFRSSITNDEDFKIYTDLDEADDLLEKEDLEAAVRKYDTILQQHILSPRAHYGKGLTLDKLGFKYMSNENLERAIDFLDRVLQLPDVPDDLVKLAGRKLADRQQFRGWGGQAVKTFKTLNQRFPEDVALTNELGVSYLMIGRNDRARDVFKEVLIKDPTDGFAKAHLGFILKTQDNDLEKAVELLTDGVKSGAPGTVDGRFYLHLGDSLLRLGRESEARQFFQEGEDKGLFLSAWQRSLYNVDRLTGRPWWTPEQTPYQEYLKILKDNWKVIRDEGLAQLNAKTGSFIPEEENLRDTGDWKQFTLYQQGRKKVENCARAPETCRLIDSIPDAKGCKRGQVKFSVMSPGIHVWPHVGPTNCRIRAHLGLVVPEGPVIRVMKETRTWKEGEFIIFDDSFEHEVWHEGSELRLVLIVDFWHPELTEAEKRRLSAI